MPSNNFLRLEKDEQFEILFRMAGFFFSQVLFSGPEIYLADRNGKLGTVSFTAASAAIEGLFALFLVVFFVKKAEETKILPLARKITASTETAAAAFTFSSVGASLISAGNFKFNDAIIESGMAAVGISTFFAIQLLKYCKADAQTKISLLDIMAMCKYPEFQPMNSGFMLGQGVSLVSFCALAVTREAYGTAASEFFSALSCLLFLGKILFTYNKTEGMKNFPYFQFMQWAAVSAGFSFLMDSLASHWNGRSNQQCLIEASIGGGLLALGFVCSRVRKYHVASDEAQPFASAETDSNYSQRSLAPVN